VVVKPKKASIRLLKAKKAPAPSKKPAKLGKKIPNVVAIEEDG
jgi:hypothetical protein